MADLKDERILILQEQDRIDIERLQDASCKRPENFWGLHFCEVCGAMLPHGQPPYLINEMESYEEPRLEKTWLCKECLDQVDPDKIIE